MTAREMGGGEVGRRRPFSIRATQRSDAVVVSVGMDPNLRFVLLSDCVDAPAK